jgi:drug/metabolite transporter (DMT)-like permease
MGAADPLRMAVDYLCLIAALVSIGAYIVALFRNRPYVRPLNSLGLLLTGGALLGLPSLVGETIAPGETVTVLYVVLLLVASAAFQIISAFRRRKPRTEAVVNS